MKTKTKTKEKMFQFAILLIIGLIVTLGVTELFNQAEKLSLTNKAKAVELFNTSYVIPTVTVPRKAELGKRIGTESWIKEQWEEAGADWNKVWAVTQGESSWNSDAWNCNTNGSLDAGLYQLNSIHNIPLSCAINTVCSTNEAIKLWKAQGWTPWVAARKLGIIK
jgi:hypothetical protein